MKDYSNYHGSSTVRMINGGKKLFQMHMSGFDASDVVVNGLPRRLIVSEKYSTKEKLRKAIDEHGHLHPGDLVYHDEKHWLVRKIDQENVVYDSATLEYAPSSLKWLLPNGEIIEQYFIFNSENLSNFGIDEGKIISLPNDRRNIAIQKSSESKKIKVGQRFIFDDAAWKVISINRLNPLIEIILESSVIDPVKDNMELRIADYIKPNYKIILDQTSISLGIDEKFQINAIVQNNGIPLLSPTLSFRSLDDSVCSVDTNGLIAPISPGSTEVTITFNDMSVSISVTVDSVPSNNYKAIITGDSSIYKSKTKTYTCSFFINEMPIDIDGIFTLTDVNGNSTTIATIVSQSNNACVIRGDLLGTFIIKVTSGKTHASKTVQVKSVI